MRDSYFDKIKFFAILSVISAHTTTSYRFMSFVFNTFGILGVPIFLFISGYFSRNSNIPWIIFLKRKLLKLILPWLLIGSVVYFISSNFGANLNTIDFTSYFEFILGFNSYLYFVPVILIIQFIIKILKNKPKILLVISMLAFFYQFLVSLQIIETNLMYLDVFFWFPYFVSGYYLSELNQFNQSIVKKIIWMIVILSTILIMILIFDQISYFTVTGFLINWTSILYIIVLRRINLKDDFFSKVGKNSYTIYLIHMPVVGLLNLLFSDVLILSVISPLLTLLSASIAIFLFNFIYFKYLKVLKFI